MNFSKTKPRKLAAATLGFTLTALAASVAQAADSDLQKQVDALDQQVRVLQRKLEIGDEDAAKAKTDNAVLTASDKGFGLKSSDGKFELKLRGLIQADARDFQEGIKGQPSGTPIGTINAKDNLLLRRVRPILEGTVNEIYGFRITTEFGNASPSLIDAYIDGNYQPYAKVRVGKFTPSVGLERLQSSADTKFNELGLPSVFLPSRDVGVQVSGDLFDNVLNYSVGLYDGANDGASGDNDTNNDKEIATRLFVQPLINFPGIFQNFGLGLGYSHTNVGPDLAPGAAPQSVNNTYLAKYKTSGQEDFYSWRSNTTPTTANTVYADGDRDHYVPQFTYYYNGLGITGEYLEEKQGVSFNGRSDELSQRAWQVTTSYILTGEEASYKSVKPIKNFDPANGGWGAWELAVRFSELDLDKTAFYGSNGVLGAATSYVEPNKSAQSVNNVALGVNWYLNKVVRVSLDYEKTTFNWGGGGTAAAPLDRPDEQVLIGRVQASF